MNAGVFLVVGLVVVSVVAAILFVNGRRRADGVDSFRRQIDALSPEARRNVVDQVQNAAERQRVDDPEAEPPDDPNQDGARGA